MVKNDFPIPYVVVPHALMFEDYPLLAGEEVKDYFQYTTYEKEGEKRVRIVPTRRFLNTVGARLSMRENNPSEKNAQLFKHFRLIYELPGPEITGQPVPAGSLKIYAVVSDISNF